MLGAVVVVVMMIVVNTDVLGRWLFNAPFQGTAELSEIGIVAIVFLQIARTVRERALTRADTLLNILSGRRIEQVIRLFCNMAGATVFGIIAHGQYPRLIASYSGGYFKGNTGVFTAPVWPLDMIILAGASFACIQFLLLAAGNGRALLAPRPSEERP